MRERCGIAPPEDRSEDGDGDDRKDFDLTTETVYIGRKPR